MPKSKQIPFNQIIDALLDVDTPFPPAFLHRFSDLETGEINKINKVWSKIPVWRRQALLEDIEELGDSDYVLSFEAFALFALKDEDPKVREIAIRSLWDYDSREEIKHFIDMLENDTSTDVKAAAASALGKFIYLGEIEEIPEHVFIRIENLLLKIVSSTEPHIVRRRALEALGFSSRNEVYKLIKSNFQSENNEWKASALLAMGRSANEKWIPQIKAMLESDVPDLRFEAARSAGELEAKDCIPGLVKLLDDDDDNIVSASLWSLSQIGGQGIREILEKRLEEAFDEDEAEFIESALENLEFTNSSSLFSLLDYSAEGDDLEELDDEFYDFEVEED